MKVSLESKYDSSFKKVIQFMPDKTYFNDSILVSTLDEYNNVLDYNNYNIGFVNDYWKLQKDNKINSENFNWNLLEKENNITKIMDEEIIKQISFYIEDNKIHIIGDTYSLEIE